MVANRAKTKIIVRYSIMKPIYHSKKFWTAVVGVLVPVANQLFGFGMSPETVLTIISPILAYVVGQGISDLKK